MSGSSSKDRDRKGNPRWFKRLLPSKRSRNPDDRAQTGPGTITPPAPSELTAPFPNQSESMSASPLHNPSRNHSLILAGVKKTLQASEALLKLAPIPKLDMIPTSLLKFLDMYEGSDDNDDDMEALKSTVGSIIDTVVHPMEAWQSAIPPDFRDKSFQLCRTLDEQTKELAKIQEQGIAKKMLLSDDYKKQIRDARMAVGDAILDFTTDSVVQTRITAHKALVELTLQKLPTVKASYLSVLKDECSPDTRVGIQKSLKKYLRDPSVRFVWLKGSPGTGKTAISKSLAGDFSRSGRLAASFFFDKSRRAQDPNLSLFISTLARQLAEFNPSYRNALFRLVDSNPQVLSLSAKDQLTILVINLLISLPKPDGKSSYLIILDGLDEHGTQRDLELLMELILGLSRLPSHFQILVSSRPEREVFDAWLQLPFKVPLKDTDQIPTEETLADIAKYIKLRISAIPNRGSSAWPPKDEELETFAKQCGEIFEIARIRVRLLEDSRGLPLDTAFTKLLQDTRRGFPRFESEYLRILRNAYFPFAREPGELHDDGEETERQEVLLRYRKVVGTIISLRRNPNIRILESLLDMSPGEIYSVLRPISSIIMIPSKPFGAIRFFHATCREFLLGEPMGMVEDEVFFFQDARGLFLGPICLAILLENLQPGRLITLWTDNIRITELSPGLDYATKHWTAHVNLDNPSEHLLQQLQQFISEYLVTWAEAIMLPVLFRAISSESFLVLTLEARKRLEPCLETLIEAAKMLPLKQDWITAVTKTFLDAVELMKISHPFSHIHPIPRYKSKCSEIHIGFNAALSIPLLNMFSHTEMGSNDEIESYPHPRRVQTSSLSKDGCLVAISYADGSFEVVDFESGIIRWKQGKLLWKSTLLPPLTWVQFTPSATIVGEDPEGMIWIINEHGIVDRLGPLSSPGLKSVAASSDTGDRIVRVPLNPTSAQWSKEVALLEIFPNSRSVHNLEVPQLDFQDAIEKGPSSSALIPWSLCFSPDGTRLGGFDKIRAFIWSCTTQQLFATYDIDNHVFWKRNISWTLPSDSFQSEVLVYPPHPPLSTAEVLSEPVSTNSPASQSVNVASSVFLQVGPQLVRRHTAIHAQKSYGYRLSALLGSKCIVTDKPGTVYFMGSWVAKIPLELLHSSEGPLCYALSGNNARLLLGGVTIPYSVQGKDDESSGSELQPTSKGVAYIPLIALDLPMVPPPS